MLTLRKYLFDLNEADKDMFLNLYLDTLEDSFFTGWDRFYHGQITVDKPWYGHVHRKQKQFKIARAGTGVFKSGFSVLEITGKETTDEQSQRRLNVRIGLPVQAMIAAIAITTLVAVFSVYFFQDIVAWSVVAMFIIVQVLLLIADLNKTDDKFQEYLEHIRNAVPHE